MSWIHINDERKPGDETVLAICSGRITEFQVYHNAYALVDYDPDLDEWFLQEHPNAYITISYWMPLPEAPKEVQDGWKKWMD